jgi:putative glutamine amidotransferase
VTSDPVSLRAPRIGLPMFTTESRPARWAISPPYVNAVRLAGGIPIPIPLVTCRDTLDAYLVQVDGLLLCGGGDVAPERYAAPDAGLCAGIDPDRDSVELSLTVRAAELGMPVLGICRGLQVMNVAAGGTLIQDLPSLRGGTVQHRTPPTARRDTLAHAVRLESDILARVLRNGPRDDRAASPDVWVNSTHHQAVYRLGDGYMIAAYAEDGIVEALVATDGCYRLGVQWHPEELQSDGQDGLHRALFTGLVRAAAQWREAQRGDS